MKDKANEATVRKGVEWTGNMFNGGADTPPSPTGWTLVAKVNYLLGGVSS